MAMNKFLSLFLLKCTGSARELPSSTICWRFYPAHWN